MKLVTIIINGIKTVQYAYKILVSDNLSDEDIMNNIKAAAVEFCNTPEGKKVLEDNHNNFNIGDFFIHVPTEIMSNHALYLPEQQNCISMNLNEVLVGETE